MPPKRRSAGATPKSNQSTLAFHGASNKVTKPGTRSANAKKNILSDSVKKEEKPEVADVQVKQEAEPTTAEAAIIEQTEQIQEQTQSTPEEEEAKRITQKQLQQYWKRVIEKDAAPRAHQKDLRLEDKILKRFDMSGQFGVSLPPWSSITVLTSLFVIAMYRYRSTEAMAASTSPRSRATSGSTCRTAERAGRERQVGRAEILCRRAVNFTSRRGDSSMICISEMYST